jgi:crotonobetainyl-CoA:carnitine CoA-transferase CaiB-like acyl-CoA transferase
VTGEFPKFDRTSTPNPIVNSYKTKDDRWLFLNMLQPDRFWPDLCRCIGRPDLVTDERFKDGIARFQNREACVAELDAVFATRTLAEWKQTLAAAEGVWAPMQSAAELYEDPAAIANGYLPEITTDDGTSFQVVAAPVQFDEVSPELRAAPAHAQHTEEVLLALGMSWEEIVAYKEDGAIS